MYEYNAEVVGVYDGDTITVKILVGFNICLQEIVNLDGIKAPTLRGTSKELGRISRDRLRALILNQKIIIKTFPSTKTKQGRYTADIYIETPSGILCVNDWLVKEKLAEYHEY